MKRNILILLLLALLTESCQTVPLRYFSYLPQGIDIILERPFSRVNIDLITAYRLRKSTKYFSEKEISIKDLSTILWAANGINRKYGKRTAPSPFGEELINLYLFSNIGIYLYDAKQNKLQLRSTKNAKKDIGAESGARGIETASLVLLLTGDLAKLPDFLKRDVKINTAHATAGTIGQNVYLIANALDLGTRFVGSLNEKGIRSCLGLSEDEIPLYIMPLGHKK
jgi:nitroreductase